MLYSANEIQRLVKEGQDVVVDEDVSLHRTWQKNGYSSKNSVVTAISVFTGKCLDYHVRVAKHDQNDRMIQTITNGKITTTVISTIQNHHVPWKQLVQ